jgi:hypothetical protein
MRRAIIILLLFITLVLALLLIFSLKPKGTVNDHLSRLDHLQNFPTQPNALSPALADYLHWETWRWYLRGKPRTSTFLQRAIDRERQALVKLGYFEKRPITLKHSPNLLVGKFGHVYSMNSSMQDHHWTIGWDAGQSQPYIIACPHDIPILETAIKEIDASLNQ